jgi:hypothetical protein
MPRVYSRGYFRHGRNRIRAFGRVLVHKNVQNIKWYYEVFRTCILWLLTQKMKRYANAFISDRKSLKLRGVVGYCPYSIASQAITSLAGTADAVGVAAFRVAKAAPTTTSSLPLSGSTAASEIVSWYRRSPTSSSETPTQALRTGDSVPSPPHSSTSRASPSRRPSSSEPLQSW